ncbi:UNVERIFIED_CONTAM: hypothetical protein HDU68_002957, partial [Siphonaria sp. JEL0065]
NLHFKLAVASGSNVLLHLHSRPDLPTPYLTLALSGTAGNLSYQISDPSDNSCSHLYRFHHTPTHFRDVSTEWKVIGGKNSIATPVRSLPHQASTRVTIVPLQGGNGDFYNPFQPTFQYRWVPKENKAFLLQRQELSTKNKNVEKEWIAQLEMDDNGCASCLKVFTSGGGEGQPVSAWGCVEECAFIVGTAFAMTLDELPSIEQQRLNAATAVAHGCFVM